ncbi:MAG: hypothetical protein WAO61_02280 [Solirubrobacterales bacterium]
MPVALAAFLLGVLIRPSSSAVNDRIAEAVAQQRAYEQAQASRRLSAQRERLNASFERRIAAARSKAYASGELAGAAAAERERAAADSEDFFPGLGRGKNKDKGNDGDAKRCILFDC